MDGLLSIGSSSHLVMDGHMSRVFSVQFTPGQDHEFLSGGWDDTVQVFLKLCLQEVIRTVHPCHTQEDPFKTH